jgi:hypothetical protein
VADESRLVFDEEYPDSVSVVLFPGDTFEMGEIFDVIQRGFWWWKSWSISRFIADTAAVCNIGGWWDDVESGFETKEEALEALKSGNFPHD